MTYARALATAFVVVLALATAGMSQTKERGLATARQLLEAFNRHDPAAMAALVTDDFELYYVTDGKSELSATGPDDLRTQMTDYFRSRPTVRSEVEGSIDGPRFVAFRERAGSRQGDRERSQSSLAVYEVVDGKIARAWYYPAEDPRGDRAAAR
jgi:hypothetical protein